jgi:hypothetical protein
VSQLTKPPTSLLLCEVENSSLLLPNSTTNPGHSCDGAFHNPFRISDSVFCCLKYLFAKRNFCWWRFRRCSPSCAAVHLIALSALATGIARANAAAAISEDRSHRPIFDSDSFNIIVDGGASACISINLANFVKPRPTTSAILVKAGYNGAMSSTKVGTICW